MLCFAFRLREARHEQSVGFRLFILKAGTTRTHAAKQGVVKGWIAIDGKEWPDIYLGEGIRCQLGISLWVSELSRHERCNRRARQMNWLKRVLNPGNPPIAVETATVEIAPVRAVAKPAQVHTRYRFGDTSTRIVAVGDIHGRQDLLQDLITRFDEFAGDTDKSFVEVYLGDYIDRGGNPKKVLDALIERKKSVDHAVICLAGNHEHMMLSALESDKEFALWISFGGYSTLQSYGINSKTMTQSPSKLRHAFRESIPASHIEFLETMPTMYEKAGFVFVHAGIRPGVPLTSQTSRDLLWIRGEFLRSDDDFGFTVVHGHTPTAQPVFRANRIGIDTGAYVSGILTGLVVTSEGVSVVDPKNRKTP